MKLLRKRFRTFGNKGFSLVELVCTMAIVSVVGTAVSGMLVVTGDSYQRGTNESQLQQEAQLVANQINDLLIDAPSGVNYSSGTLTITKGGVEYKVSYNATDKTLEYTEGGDTQVMARNVEAFSVDTSTYDDYGYAKMDLKLSNEDRIYPAVFTMSARNKDMTSTISSYYYLDTVTEHIMEPNCSKPFTATLYGASAYTLAWSLHSTPADSNTKLVGNALEIGTNETANQVTLKVVASDAVSSLAERFVQVKVRRVNSIAINEGPVLVSGDDKKAGAKYRFTAMVSGNNLDKHSSEDATDYAGKDPYAVRWTNNGTSGLIGDTSETVSPTDTRCRNYFITLARDMNESEVLTVRATSKHATGTNKSNMAYDNNVFAEKQLVGPDPVVPPEPVDPPDPYIIPGAGWMRMSNQAQGTIDNSIHTLKQSLKDNIPGVVGDLKHRVLIKYREYPGGTYQSNWLPNIYGDADNSMSINLRPLVTGAFDYRKDYEVMLKLSIVDSTGNEIWPIAGVTHDSEYLLVQVMPKVGASFKSNLLGFTETQRVEEAVAPVLSGARRDQQYEIMELVNLVGVDKEGNGFTNGIRFYLDKKTASGYDPVTSGYEIQNQNGKCMITFRTDDYAGTYRIRVQSENQPRYELNDTTGVLTQNGNMTYVLSNTSTGHNVFHFRVN